ncbi:TetR/AcrR family transcriptional regulator [Nocardioides sp. NPDC051685]|uniref:TetR/AcrR family transcriptional regulator n=1 Tax=Nocardioides sp. NPDC051685 TaxID=3364334 RepID=UPI0037B7FA77
MSDPKRGVRPVSTRPRRADAVANRAKVVAAAREAFATAGLEVSLDEIARRAGVGAGTVHRHFATKAELVDTVLAAAVEDLVVTAESYAASEDAGGALRAFLRHLVTEGAAAHELAARLHAGAGDVDAAVSRPVAELNRALGVLLSRARDAGAVRDDVDRRDLAAIVAAAHAAYVHPAGGDRAVALVLRALD